MIEKLLDRLIQTQLDAVAVSLFISAMISVIVVYGLACGLGGL